MPVTDGFVEFVCARPGNSRAGTFASRGRGTAGGRSADRRVGIEPPRRVPQVAAAHDVVAFEHGPGLVAGQLHGHAFRYAGPHEGAHGGPPEVVGDAARTAYASAV